MLLLSLLLRADLNRQFLYSPHGPITVMCDCLLRPDRYRQYFNTARHGAVQLLQAFSRVQATRRICESS